MASIFISGDLNLKTLKRVKDDLEKIHPNKTINYYRKSEKRCPGCKSPLHEFSLWENGSSTKIFVCVHCYTVEEKKFVYKETEIKQVS